MTFIENFSSFKKKGIKTFGATAANVKKRNLNNTAGNVRIVTDTEMILKLKITERIITEVMHVRTYRLDQRRVRYRSLPRVSLLLNRRGSERKKKSENRQKLRI